MKTVKTFEEFVNENYSLNEARKEKTLTIKTLGDEDFIQLDAKIWAKRGELDIDLFKNMGLFVPRISPINIKEIRDYYWDERNGLKHSIPRLGHEVWCRSVLAGWGKSKGETIDSIKKQMKYPELSDQELESLVRERMNTISQMISKADKTIENALKKVKWPDIMGGKISPSYDKKFNYSTVNISPTESLDVESKEFPFEWKAIPPRKKWWLPLNGKISVVDLLKRGTQTNVIDQDYILNSLVFANIGRYYGDI